MFGTRRGFILLVRLISARSVAGPFPALNQAAQGGIDGIARQENERRRQVRGGSDSSSLDSGNVLASGAAFQFREVVLRS